MRTVDDIVTEHAEDAAEEAIIHEAHALGRSEVETEVAKLRAEARVWYGPNGPEDLDPEEVVRRRKAAAEEMKRLRAESEERERALREIAERGCMSVINETDCIGRGEPTHWMCGACRARAALRPHKEGP